MLLRALSTHPDFWAHSALKRRITAMERWFACCRGGGSPTGGCRRVAVWRRREGCSRFVSVFPYVFRATTSHLQAVDSAGGVEAHSQGRQHPSSSKWVWHNIHSRISEQERCAQRRRPSPHEHKTEGIKRRRHRTNNTGISSCGTARRHSGTSILKPPDLSAIKDFPLPYCPYCELYHNEPCSILRNIGI